MLGSQVFLPLLSSLSQSTHHHSAPKRLSVIQGLVLIFLATILLGMGLLAIPQAHRISHVSLVDCLFTATSALTLTGLVTVSTAETWSRFGQVIILLLMQLGGLLYLTAAVFLAIRLGVSLRLSEKLHLVEMHGRLGLRNLMTIFRYVALVVFSVEIIGAIVLMVIQHRGAAGWGYAAFSGIFYAVSAFCNAGFNLEPQFWGLAYPSTSSNVPLLAALAVLAFLGGLGITVIAEIGVFLHTKRISLHAKLVLVLTILLVVLGTFVILLFEGRNPSTIASMSGPTDRILSATFLSVSARSAGFSPVDLTTITPPTLLILGLLMLIGGAPAGTASGVKVSTIGVIFLAILASLRRRVDIEIFRRRISGDTVRLALSLVSIYMFSILLITIGVCVTEITAHGVPPTAATMNRFVYLVFEVLSAFTNVGFQTGITPTLKLPSHILIMLAMLIGRLGPLAFVYIFSQAKRPSLRRLPTESVLAG
ncbi:MAG TPA: potassium transporter TrkG [Armatimonadota bacterium]|nr:potassium transporter TrkG [Armatimonadota bacterium]